MKNILFVVVCGGVLCGCAPTYSPNTYSSNAVQLANKVDTGTVVGYRQVSISTNGTIGAVTGGATGGLLGSEYADSALVALAGSAVGATVGNSIDHAMGDTTGWEYIVRKSNGDMLSVTQREKKPLAIGQKVLVINGPQARVIPDYSVAQEAAAAPPPEKQKTEAKPPEPPVKVELVLSLPPGVGGHIADSPNAAVTPSLISVAPLTTAALSTETHAPPPPAPAESAPPVSTPASQSSGAADAPMQTAHADAEVPLTTPEKTDASNPVGTH